jgi:hypothetical protein
MGPELFGPHFFCFKVKIEPAKQKVPVPPHKTSGIKRRREFLGMRRTYVRRSEHEMKRNAEIGLFTKPSKLIESQTQIAYFED